MSTHYTSHEELVRALNRNGQEHLAQQLNELGGSRREELFQQLVTYDWERLGRLVQTYVLSEGAVKIPEELQPAPYYPMPPAGPDQEAQYRAAWAKGAQLVLEGKVALFTVAGGQGSRLGFEHPKGLFPASPIRRLSLFGWFAESLHHMQRRFRTVIPWYIMTSQTNHDATVGFFEENDYFGLDPQNLMFFSQAMLPAFDLETGKALLKSPTSLALSPNGHGGSLTAIRESGALADMRRRGIEHISYIQVDNPLVRPIDPLFIGLHALADSEMSSKMLPKREPMEKLGNFCMCADKLWVIEYSDMPVALAEEVDPGTGRLRFLAGSIAIHVLRVDFVERLTADPDQLGLPFHRAEKAVAYWDPACGAAVSPSGKNAVKLEMFVFDALPLCSRTVILETSREEEFAPIKDADGRGLDSPLVARRALIERGARWLEQNGVLVARDVAGEVAGMIEISPFVAIYPEDLQAYELPAQILEGDTFLL